MPEQTGVNQLSEVRKAGKIWKVRFSTVQGFKRLTGIPLITREAFPDQGILVSPEIGWGVEALQCLRQLDDGSTEVDLIDQLSNPDRHYTFLPASGSSPVLNARDETKTTYTELILEQQKASAILATGAVWMMTDTKKVNLSGYTDRIFQTLWFDLDRGVIVRPLALDSWPHLALLPIDSLSKFKVLPSADYKFQEGINAGTEVYDVEKRARSKAGEFMSGLPPAPPIENQLGA